MPNECDNWVRITGPAHLLQQFEAKPFDLDAHVPKPEQYKGPQPKETYFAASEWVQTNWGTRWIAAMNSDNDVRLQSVNGGLEATFISAWAPPIPFYNTLATQYPDLQFEYEYAEWGMGFCGHGIGRFEGLPNHYDFGTKEEMESLNQFRKWHVCIWNPHFIEPEPVATA
jgi:hypothetical protein